MTTTKPCKPNLADLGRADASWVEPKVWRLIPPLEASGKVQMAIDRWLLDQYCRGVIPPTLRFYTWSPIALSLGYHQQKYPPFWQTLTWKQQPIDLVRRPSGGRAVLHQGDLTYAIVTSAIAGNRMQTYCYICEFLIRGWRSLGVELRYGEAGRSYIHNPNCFGTATVADLVTPNGAKFIGSAQLYRKLEDYNPTGQKTAVLQHGSMRLDPDPELFQQVFAVPMEPVAPLEQSWGFGSTFEKTVEVAIATSTASAETWFGIRLITQPLSEAEWQEIRASLEKFDL
ncbi:MAG: lipoate--protein ligase family protein [Oscillatoriophycideae cyanobacterium NC_groundwater_1537_Pr4_S-0.65um_50_18]|nr:lipoate--protein ligase family protein [Oscillatoriophycideae cyanobacterium NC_groundwater_1537_Pr4_S-0.65um_50_18]